MMLHSKSNKATQTRDTDRYASIRSLIEDDNIEAAIMQLQKLIDGRDVPVANDLISLQARLSRVTNEETAGRLTWGEAHVEKNKITHHLLQLIDKIDVRPTRHFPLRELTAAEKKRRTGYLQDLKADVENRLRVSIHHARLIDLGIDDTPSATHLPWIYTDVNSKHDFNDYQEAFDTYDRRMLLLGSPGSGKTITLLHIAQQLITEAENDDNAPIPLLVNLSKFRPSIPQNRLFSFLNNRRSKVEAADKRIERWLINEFTSNPFISVEIAKTWIEEGRIAALLDGLDEVSDEYRAELVRILNATYLHDYPDAVVVVCSRVNEYRPLQDRKETRVALRGAVTLQPLTSSQIQEYLELAQADGLRKALVTDETLYQMAQTPLTLSMMTLAYGGLGPSHVTANLSFIERRHHMMDAYVAKMLQRKERRDRNLHFDENPNNDIPARDYSYRPQTINSFLGWLAVRMSVRAQTAVSFQSFYSFLSRDIDKDRQSGVWLATAICRLPLLFVNMILVGITLAPPTTGAWLQTLYISFIGAIFFLPTASTLRQSDPDIEPSLWQVISDSFAGFMLFLGLFANLGIAAVALSAILPYNVPPTATIILATCSTVALVLVSVDFSDNKFIHWFFTIGTFGILFVAIILMKGMHSPLRWYIPAVSLVIFQTITLLRISSVPKKLQDRRRYVWLTILGFLACLATSAWIMDGFQWHVALASYILVAVVIVGATRRAFLPLVGFSFSFMLGGAALKGYQGAVVGGLLYGYLIILGFLIVDLNTSTDPFRKRVSELAGHSLDRFQAFADRYLLTPVILRILAVNRRLPLWVTKFFRYSEDALLLKRSAGDIEFMHRLLRDYFALRDLQPLLITDDPGQRLQAIRSLGFQGDAAIDALAEFVRHADPEIREAATLALGRVASLAVIPHIEAALKDRTARVRRAGVLSTRNLTAKEQIDLLLVVMTDVDYSVQQALFETVLSQESTTSQLKGSIGLNAKRRPELRQILFDLLSNKTTEADVRVRALDIIEKLADPDSVPALISALSDRSFYYRFEAARIMGLFDEERVVRALTMAQSDGNKRVRLTATETLGYIQYLRARGKF